MTATATFGVLALFALSGSADARFGNGVFRGAQSINQWRLRQVNEQTMSRTHAQQVWSAPVHEEFPPQTFTQPLDHWDNSLPTFEQRYWVNKRHYKPGGPVIVIDGGETSGEDRLPFLDTGIADILANATNGVGVVLEHRYYGGSIPVQNFSTDALRWLTNAQSLEDSAYFMSNVNFSSSGIDEDLTAPGTPWIYYGGSYAGARAAHMRVLYPDLVYGAIASSAVTHATIDNWEYMEIIRRAADEKCSLRIQKTIEQVDQLLSKPWFGKPLKRVFGLGSLTHDDDFVSTLTWPLSYFQGKNWDPRVGASGFEEFCDILGGQNDDNDSLLYPDVGKLSGSWRPSAFPLDITLLNYAKYIREHVVSQCKPPATQDECFGTHEDKKFRDISLSQEWRAWTFQVCTEWGYFIPAPPDPNHPSLLSRLIDIDYEAKICRQAFPQGQYFEVPAWPNVTAVNALGDFDLAADRLAFIDGSIDPWRPCTPHSYDASNRKDTILRPFKLIPTGVHHHDENGLADHQLEPEHIQRIHREEIEFVLAWLKDWKAPK